MGLWAKFDVFWAKFAKRFCGGCEKFFKKASYKLALYVRQLSLLR